MRNKDNVSAIVTRKKCQSSCGLYYQKEWIPYKDNSLAIEDDSVPNDAYECRHKQKVDLATFCRDLARCQVPCVPDQRPIVPHQQNSFRDYGQTPVCPLVSADIPYEAIPIKKIRIIFKKWNCL